MQVCCPVCESSRVTDTWTPSGSARLCINCGALSPKNTCSFDKGAYQWSKDKIHYADRTELTYFATRLSLLIQKSGQPIRKVVDMGCGPGLLLDAARQAGLATAGVEINFENAAICKSKEHDVINSDIKSALRSKELMEILRVPDSPTLLIFQNALIYNLGVASILRSAYELLKTGDCIYINDQSYPFSIRGWHTFLQRSSTGKMKFIASWLTFDLVMTNIGMKKVFSRNQLGTFEGLYKKIEPSTKKRGFLSIPAHTLLILSWIDPFLSLVYRRIIGSKASLKKCLTFTR